MKTWLAAGVAGLFALSASAASAATTSCSTVAACVFGSNSSSGIGVEGSSKSGFGVSGVSSSGHGVNGTSSSSFGVVGITTVNAKSTSTARAGVLGEDSSGGSQYNSGVSGTSNYGYGVYGSAPHGYGLYGYASSGYGVGASGLTGLFAVGESYGVNAQSPKIGLYASGDSSGDAIHAATVSGTAVLASAVSGSIFVGQNQSADVVSIDSKGNAIFAGSVTQSGTPDFRTKSALGPDVASFGTRSAAPSLEDVGKAQLRNGAAYVALDRTFASTIDPHVAYSVFLTPEGDSNGLYTSALGPTGFAVRENRGGHSSLVFDYRIVGKPLDSAVKHLPAMKALTALRKAS